MRRFTPTARRRLGRDLPPKMTMPQPPFFWQHAAPVTFLDMRARARYWRAGELAVALGAVERHPIAAGLRAAGRA